MASIFFQRQECCAWLWKVHTFDTEESLIAEPCAQCASCTMLPEFMSIFGDIGLREALHIHHI